MSTTHQRHRKLTADDFRDLLDRANVSHDQYKMLTGASAAQLEAYLDDEHEATPGLGEIVLMELMLADPDIYEHAIAIAKQYLARP